MSLLHANTTVFFFLSQKIVFSFFIGLSASVTYKQHLSSNFVTRCHIVGHSLLVHAAAIRNNNFIIIGQFYCEKMVRVSNRISHNSTNLGIIPCLELLTHVSASSE